MCNITGFNILIFLAILHAEATFAIFLVTNMSTTPLAHTTIYDHLNSPTTDCNPS